MNKETNVKCQRCQAPNGAIVQCLIDADKGTMQIYFGERPIASENGTLKVTRLCPDCAKSFLDAVRVVPPAWFECSLCGRRYEADEAHDKDTLMGLWVDESHALAHEHDQQKIENATAKRRATLAEKRRQQYEADTTFRKPG